MIKFEHQGTEWTVRAINEFERSMANVLLVELVGMISGQDYQSSPTSLKQLAYYFINWAMVTNSDAISYHPFTPNKEEYEHFVGLVTGDTLLASKWKNAYETANLETNSPNSQAAEPKAES